MKNNFIKKINSNQKTLHCVGGRHMSNTYNLLEYERFNAITNRIVKSRK